jgi:hypothetical protein
MHKIKQNCLLTFSRNSMATTAYFARFYRPPGSAILLQKQVSKASIAKIVGVNLPPFTALSRQGGYAHTLKGYFYTNLGGTLIWVLSNRTILTLSCRHRLRSLFH